VLSHRPRQCSHPSGLALVAQLTCGTSASKPSNFTLKLSRPGFGPPPTPPRNSQASSRSNFGTRDRPHSLA
jgi:hypothetical protein